MERKEAIAGEDTPLCKRNCAFSSQIPNPSVAYFRLLRTSEWCGMAPNIKSLDDLRRKVISDLVDLDLMIGRAPLTRRQRFTRDMRRRGATLARFGR